MEKTLDPVAIYQSAYQFYQAGRFRDSGDLFRLLTTLEPTHIRHWMGLGASLQMEKKYREAVDTYGAAALLETSETNPFPHAHAATCLLELGEIERARQAIKSALTIATKDEKYHALVKQLELMNQQWGTHGHNTH